jgi:hypothetical protein
VELTRTKQVVRSFGAFYGINTNIENRSEKSSAVLLVLSSR